MPWAHHHFLLKMSKSSTPFEGKNPGDMFLSKWAGSLHFESPVISYQIKKGAKQSRSHQPYCGRVVVIIKRCHRSDHAVITYWLRKGYQKGNFVMLPGGCLAQEAFQWKLLRNACLFSLLAGSSGPSESHSKREQHTSFYFSIPSLSPHSYPCVQQIAITVQANRTFHVQRHPTLG